ncbi:MAG TPA: hypothetical protein VIJ75_09695 [Hanamia sp.]
MKKIILSILIVFSLSISYAQEEHDVEYNLSSYVRDGYKDGLRDLANSTTHKAKVIIYLDPKSVTVIGPIRGSWVFSRDISTIREDNRITETYVGVDNQQRELRVIIIRSAVSFKPLILVMEGRAYWDSFRLSN